MWLENIGEVTAGFLRHSFFFQEVHTTGEEFTPITAERIVIVIILLLIYILFIVLLIRFILNSFLLMHYSRKIQFFSGCEERKAKHIIVKWETIGGRESSLAFPPQALLHS